MKICFIDNTNFKYSFNDKNNPLLRGAETTLINLSYNLSLINNEVHVYNNCSENFYSNNYIWQNISLLEKSNILFDVAIANGDINLLNNVNARKKFAISYSIQTIEKFIRKNQLLTYLKNKPKIILIGDYHKTKRNILTRIWGHNFLELSVDDNFINTEIDFNNQELSNQAIFTSRPDRNGKKLIEIWRDKIFPFRNNIKLLFTPNIDIENLNSFNIFYRKMKDQIELIKDLKNSRVMLLPGHKAELFCLAAEEARELCLPIVTLGIGSLRERVIHNETGFIAKNDTQFAKYTLDLFNDDDLCIQLKKNLYKLRNQRCWSKSAKNFLGVLSK
jgi:glycosyltransferase involved in cell wall biosynthesis